MPPLTIRLKKIPGGSASLSCTRADGSVTWQRTEGGQAEFFPQHDLTHYAVETILGHRLGFFGLLASGWDFTDFGSPWPRGRIPANSDPSELIVGLMDAQRASGEEWTAAEIKEQAGKYLENLGQQAPNLQLTDVQLTKIRAMMKDLFARWDNLLLGETLELTFHPHV